MRRSVWRFSDNSARQVLNGGRESSYFLKGKKFLLCPLEVEELADSQGEDAGANADRLGLAPLQPVELSPCDHRVQSRITVVQALGDKGQTHSGSKRVDDAKSRSRGYLSDPDQKAPQAAPVKRFLAILSAAMLAIEKAPVLIDIVHGLG